MENRALQALDEAVGPRVARFGARVAQTELTTRDIKRSLELGATIGEDASHWRPRARVVRGIGSVVPQWWFPWPVSILGRIGQKARFFVTGVSTLRVRTPISRQGVEHTARFRGLAAAITQLCAPELVLDGEVYGGDRTGPNPTDRAKRGNKRHLICDRRGAPLAVRVTGANRNSQEALTLVGQDRISWHVLARRCVVGDCLLLDAGRILHAVGTRRERRIQR